MKNQNLNNLFVDELKDMYDSENQIVNALPQMITRASSEVLKEALAKHLEETQNQVMRLEQIFSLMDLEPVEKTCEAMEGMIEEADELTEDTTPSPALDAAIISAAQKVEHYEIASYGSLRNFAKNLKMNSEIISMIEDTLAEEQAADKKLTKIAEGTLFSTGVNQEAAKVANAGGRRGK